MSEWIIALCMAAVELGTVRPPIDDRVATCYAVAAAVVDRNLPPELGVALSYTESRFNAGASSSVGAAGPLQVLPRWFCPNGKLRGCDLIEAGGNALTRYVKKYGPSWSDVLCHWSQGNRCYSVGRRFARIVVDRAESFRHRAMSLVDHE